MSSSAHCPSTGSDSLRMVFRDGAYDGAIHQKGSRFHNVDSDQLVGDGRV